MKKLLVLMLVLGMATVANAALFLSVNGDIGVEEYEMDICTTIIIDVYSDTDNFAYGAYVGIADNSTGGEWTGNNYVYPAAGQGSISVYDDWWWELSCLTSDPTNFPITAGRHFDLEYHCLGPYCEYVTIQLTDLSGMVILDEIVIHQVPEPATMALLGLGGLFLLRRRK